MDDDTARLAELAEIKRARLYELDKQAAMLGTSTPPHIQVERAQLRDELGIVESVIGWSPARPAIGDELGPNGRFLAYMVETRRGNTEAHRANQEAQRANQEARRANDGIASLGERMDERFQDVFALMKRHGQYILLIGAIVIVILVGGAVVITILVMRGA